ncbi:alpha/beta fold hydrolase [Stagnimonas aquatica]|uniref:Alpha/beta fold hydrolase n=1 Tax=Stagnimonas aquatica TaxID=2689987 RepID=A0A3N0V2F1_9GAMM|nr:alpha/beta fold hydrolase [Stagnimonas aquatica]ROH86711.1 alpha/beta fold hydrolase [Stagnimonas aquatica]
MTGSLMRRLTTTVELPGEAPLSIAAEVFAPDQLTQPPVALVCLPGGGMSRRYYDLRSSDGDESFSFARQMAGRGYLVVTLDHAGIGDSDKPADSYALTPERVMQANAEATALVLEQLRSGALLPQFGPLPALRSVGVGHSMGAMFTVLQQAAHAQHAGIVVLGFSTRGLPEYVSPRVKELAAESVAAVRAEVVPLARKMFVSDYPEIKGSPTSNSIFAGASADPRGVEAIKAARAPLLPVPAFFSMIPGNIAPEAAQVSVPVFLGIGERDMVGAPQQVPAAFAGSQDLTLYIQPQAGHSHFLFASRRALYRRLDAWVRTVLAHLDEV